MMSNSAVLSRKGLNGKSSGAVLIQVTEEGTEKFLPLYVVAIVRTLSGLVSVPLISVGTNGSSYNNVIAITTLTGLTAVDNFLPVQLTTASALIPPNTGVYCNVTTIAVGTTFTFDIYIHGIYVS